MAFKNGLWARTNFPQTWMRTNLISRLNYCQPIGREHLSTALKNSLVHVLNTRTKAKNTLSGSNQLALHVVSVSLENNQQSPAGGFTAN